MVGFARVICCLDEPSKKRFGRLFARDSDVSLFPEDSYPRSGVFPKMMDLTVILRRFIFLES